MVNCLINDQKIFSFTKGTRIVTDLNGKLIEAVGIETQVKTIQVKSKQVSYSMNIEPNGVYRINQVGELSKYKSVEFSALNHE
jgi:hypothetical protein